MSHKRSEETAVRPEWADLPAALRSAIVGRLGSAPAAAVAQAGGFTPGLATRLSLSSGETVFVKAISASHQLADAYRYEAAVTAAMPCRVPAPRLRWEADLANWVVLAFQSIEGGRHPDLSPGGDLAEVLAAVGTLSVLRGADLPPVLRTAVDDRPGWLYGWSAIATAPPAGLDPWAAAHLSELAAAEKSWAADADGGTLLHGDLRADNMIIAPTGTWLVDWAHASRGAAWLDLADLVPHLLLVGHRPAAVEERLARLPTWQSAPPDAVTRYAAAMAGYWFRMSQEPAPERVPYLRPYQARAGRAALSWVQYRW